MNMYSGDLVMISDEPQRRSLGDQLFHLKKSFKELLSSHATFIESRMNQIGRDMRLVLIFGIVGVPIFSAGMTLLALAGIKAWVESDQAAMAGTGPVAVSIGGGLILVSIVLSIFAILRIKRVHETARDIRQEFKTDVETYVLGGSV